MVHDCHILVVEPGDIDRLLNDRMTVSITTFSVIFNLLLAERDQSTTNSTSATNRMYKIHICQQCLSEFDVMYYACVCLAPVEEVHPFYKSRNPWFYLRAQQRIDACVCELDTCQCMSAYVRSGRYRSRDK